VAIAARWEAERPEGELHTPGTGRHVNAIVSQAKAGVVRALRTGFPVPMTEVCR
jgi:hypothetical protein